MGRPYCNELADWHDLRNALLTAEAVTVSALHRDESRGAHQRADYPDTLRSLRRNQTLRMDNGVVSSSFAIAEALAT